MPIQKKKEVQQRFWLREIYLFNNFYLDFLRLKFFVNMFMKTNSYVCAPLYVYNRFKYSLVTAKNQ